MTQLPQCGNSKMGCLPRSQPSVCTRARPVFAVCGAVPGQPILREDDDLGVVGLRILHEGLEAPQVPQRVHMCGGASREPRRGLRAGWERWAFARVRARRRTPLRDRQSQFFMLTNRLLFYKVATHDATCTVWPAAVPVDSSGPSKCDGPAVAQIPPLPPGTCTWRA